MKLSRSGLKLPFFPLLLLFGLAGMLLILYATSWGAALSDDSYFYIKPARDMLAGQPYHLSPHYAPALPYLLTAIGWTGVDPQIGIRYLNAFCFGLNIFLAGYLVYRISGRRGAGLLAAGLVLLAQPMIEVHAWAMSEALFISLVLGCFCALHTHFEKGGWRWLLTAALLAGLAALTRYAGLALIAAGAAGLVLAGSGALPRRILSAVVFTALSSLIFSVYLLGYQPAAGEVSRFGGLQLINPSGQSLTDLLYNSLLWFAPGRLVRGREGWATAVVALIAAGLWAAYMLSKKISLRDLPRRIGAHPSALVLLLFSLASLFLLYQANISSTYRSPFDFRLLAPAHLALLLLAVAVVGRMWGGLRRIARVALLLAVVLLAGIYGQRAAATVQLYHSQGMGFASRYWHELDAVAYLRGLPAGVKLATTAPMGVYFASGREAVQAADFTPEQLEAWLRSEQGYLVFFHSMPFDIYGKDEQSYLSRLQLVEEYSDSAVYRAR